jgi:methionyl-tRNA formyltransferase
MKTVFFGTPRWAVPSLEAIARSDVEVAAVVTNPDRPGGRGMDLHAPPVKELATELGLPVLQPASARAPEFHAALSKLAPDVCTVVAYGKILPADLLAIPRLGFVNLHFSLLPEYRGAAPVQRAIMEGRTSTGISVLILTAGMDEGPVLSSSQITIRDEDTAGELGDRLADEGSALLVETLAAYGAGQVSAVEQDHARATYAPKITTEEARIDWTLDASAIRNQVRGLNPQPGAWTTLRGRRVKIWRVEPISQAGLAPGELAARDDVLVVGAAGAALSLERIQLEGKSATSGSEAARGLRLARDERFE